MNQKEPIFTELESPDDVLAMEVARRLTMQLPAECVAGVATNARLLQRHVDILRGIKR